MRGKGGDSYSYQICHKTYNQHGTR
jgi:hypothetical protein